MTVPRSPDRVREPDPELASYLAEHAAPAACADALIRDAEGRILLVDPVYKDGWDLPGGMLEDEEPVLALARELDEELGLTVEVGRLLVVDTIPAEVYGRTVLSFVYAGRVRGAADGGAATMTLQDCEIREAGFFRPPEALGLLPAPLRRRLAAALDAERGAHTEVLRDGHRPPGHEDDRRALLPAPLTAVAVLVTDPAGRVLVLDPGHREGPGLPGGRVAADETPARAAGRVLAELGVAGPVGRLLAVDASPGVSPEASPAPWTAPRRALTCLLFAAPVPTAERAGELVRDGGQHRARWLEPDEAVRCLPVPVAGRLAAGLGALASGGVRTLDDGVPVAVPDGATTRERAARARAGMVERLESAGVLTDPRVRRALLAIRREVLLPRCYVPRPGAPDGPEAWQLLDGADARDREEWLERIHDGGPVLVQHRGEPLDRPERGRVVTGGGFTGRSTGLATAVTGLQDLGTRPGHRVLEAGTGPGLVTAALCELLGDTAVTTVETDALLAGAARTGLALLGHRPRLVHGDAPAGCPGERFDRILLSFAVRCLPGALLEQLADGGLLLAPVTTGCAGWPARADVHRSGGALTAVLRPVPPGHRPGRGPEPAALPARAPEGPVAVRTSTFAPPAAESGFWLAVGHTLPGVVRDTADPAITLRTPGDGSGVVVRADGGAWTVERTGPRDIWEAVEDVHARWVRAGSPRAYLIDLTDPAVQRVSGGSGPHPLEWDLPTAPLAAIPHARRESPAYAPGKDRA
ncbi:NUDIX domain-containing protein [Streptomyces sp. NPDC087658]|uniref:NUDIX domain-containing protein n=1 Tax=Streptomyces sp. NPDC087658 TaxID=3365800 RepID=UPI0038269DC4